MKRIVSFILVAVAVTTLFVGCGLIEKDGLYYSKLLPDPKEFFKTGEVSIIACSGSPNYYVKINHFTKEEYTAFLNECKEMGFTNVELDYETDGVLQFISIYESKDAYLCMVFNLNDDSGIFYCEPVPKD